MKTTPILNFQQTGSGPVVVLLHGYMASSRYWENVTEELSKQHRVIALDLLGFGHSPKPACSRYDYTVQLASIRATLDNLHITEPYTLVGHSMGSLIALRYARNHQSEIKKLILTNMPVFLNSRDAKEEILGTNFFYRLGLKRGLHSLIWPIFRFVTTVRLLPSRVGDNARARRHYMFQSTGISRLRSMRNIIFAGKIQTDLKLLHIETVVLSGLQDRMRYIDNLKSLTLSRNIHVLNVTGGHHLPLLAPEQITTRV